MAGILFVLSPAVGLKRTFLQTEDWLRSASGKILTTDNNSTEPHLKFI